MQQTQVSRIAILTLLLWNQQAQAHADCNNGFIGFGVYLTHIQSPDQMIVTVYAPLHWRDVLAIVVVLMLKAWIT